LHCHFSLKSVNITWIRFDVKKLIASVVTTFLERKSECMITRQIVSNFFMAWKHWRTFSPVGNALVSAVCHGYQP